MPTPRALLTFLVLLGALLGRQAEPAHAQDGEPAIVLKLSSGRQFAGVLDRRTSSEEVVLRSTSGGVTIQRPIRWERVVAVTIDGEPRGVAQLRAEIGKGDDLPDRVPKTSEVSLPPALPEELPTAAVPVGMAPRLVSSVTFDARIGHWRSGVEATGLLIDLAPLDHFGRVVPVNGTLMVELFAPQRRAFHHAPMSSGDTLQLVERWQCPIHAAAFRMDGVLLGLPFGAIHPEIDSDWLASSYGLIHVRLMVPGHGTFDHSIDGVRLRPWTPNRDRLELGTGDRFLPTETLGRPQRSVSDR